MPDSYRLKPPRLPSYPRVKGSSRNEYSIPPVLSHASAPPRFSPLPKGARGLLPREGDPPFR